MHFQNTITFFIIHIFHFTFLYYIRYDYRYILRYNFFGRITWIGMCDIDIHFWWFGFQIFGWETQKVKKIEKNSFLIANQFLNITIRFYSQNYIYFHILINIGSHIWIIWGIEGRKLVCSNTRAIWCVLQICTLVGTYQFSTLNTPYNSYVWTNIDQNVKIYVVLAVESDGNI